MLASVPVKPLIQEISSTTTLNSQQQSGATFTFTHLPNARFQGFEDKEIQELLFKWGMRDHMFMQRYTYDQLMQPYQLEEFVSNFFKSPDVIGNFKVLTKSDSWSNIGTVQKVVHETTPATTTTLDIFTRLKTHPTHAPVREDGSIRKCLEEQVDGYLISDELRRTLLDPVSESYDIFSPADRRELIFQLFKSLCLGGRLCQFEDEVGPYLDVTRRIYKDLVSVTKKAEDGTLAVSSVVVRIRDLVGGRLFPMMHEGNWCFMTIDPLRRAVAVVYHASEAYYT